MVHWLPVAMQIKHPIGKSEIAVNFLLKLFTANAEIRRLNSLRNLFDKHLENMLGIILTKSNGSNCTKF